MTRCAVRAASARRESEMSAVTVRKAEVRDVPRIGELLCQVCNVHAAGRPDLFRAGARKYADEQLEEIVKQNDRPILVAVDEDDRVLGYAFCQLQEGGKHHALHDVKTLYIDDLCVDETCRGQHIGRTLYEAVLALARERGCYNVTLHVWNCNTPAIGFYEALGMQCRQMEMETVL